MSEDRKSVVVFYDCCIPRKRFERVLHKVAPFAEHIFVLDVFAPSMCEDDRGLFAAICGLAADRYHGRMVLFVTNDKLFSSEIRGYSSSSPVKLMYVDCGKSRRDNTRKARKIAHVLVDEYLDYLIRVKKIRT
ncbi:MAG: hypothetical protein A2847_01725 [Candidatus Sungbacteria bacterium RIFCSPHIGHO2_01_FULL_50_25]|uniref:Uncharacterized protein n=1 Tax=Candidatus Sungbacteria bacterium RIFCSPHIGHO2_01_FULL_50_25 TaxID=1802265 RepID=A0A1G2KBX0_9BACT|nr:MAG: hypothetical protein A2847_01725 [Candidatus Sungbacteria bacterium RIFCSPHIGHO2_01_FULL_50_25]